MISVAALLIALFGAPDIHRCGLSALQYEASSGAKSEMGVSPAINRSTVAANTKGSRLLRTQHMAIWYKIGNDSDAITPALATIPATDTVPTMVREIAIALEQAWTYYVDTLGMLPPLPSSAPGVIAEAPPAGLYPVEICRAERASPGAIGSYFGLARYDQTEKHPSRLFIASKVLGTGWSYLLQSGGTYNVNYSANLTSWRKALQATAAHELFHAVQFRYETNLSHFLFEASAVAVEDAVLPDVDDHLYYLSQLFGFNQDKYRTLPFMQTDLNDAYRHALYVMGIMQDAGPGILRTLWEDRATRSNSDRTTILATLRDNLAKTPLPLRESVIRYGQRILVAGNRRGWTTRWDTIPTFHPWDRAALSPILDSILKRPVVGTNSWTLGPGELRFLSDPPITGDLRVTWLPTGGAFLVRLDSTSDGFIRQTFAPGITSIPASRRKSSLWIVGSDGTDPSNPTATSYTNATANLSFKQSSPAIPSTDSCLLRQSFPQLSGDSIVLQGCPTSSHPSYEMDATIDTLPASDALRDSLAIHGKALVLSSNPTLSLRNATLSIPGRWKFAYQREGASWKRLPLRASGTRSVLSWANITIADSFSLLLTSQSTGTAPFPNPSRDDQPITFPLGNELENLKLSIFASDGSLVRQWGATELSFNTVWNLRNLYGYRVRPGVYTWVLSGSRSERGRLLIAR